MSYVNVGARTAKGSAVPTKKNLKDLLASDPDNVMFYHTAPSFNGPGEFSGSQIPDGVTLSVCGPDPATSRKWFASVTKGAKKGTLKVS